MITLLDRQRQNISILAESSNRQCCTRLSLNRSLAMKPLQITFVGRSAVKCLVVRRDWAELQLALRA